jgi:hypothetical protein
MIDLKNANICIDCELVFDRRVDMIYNIDHHCPRCMNKITIPLQNMIDTAYNKELEGRVYGKKETESSKDCRTQQD